MGLMNWANRNQKIAVPLAVLLLVGAGAIVFMNTGRRSQDTQRYYYDLGSGQIFKDSRSLVPPIPAPSGKEGLPAAVFSCSSCDDASSRYVGWVNRYSPAAQEALRQQNQTQGATETQGLAETIDAGTEIAFAPSSAKGDLTWLPLLSPEAIARRNDMIVTCPPEFTAKGPVKSCIP